METDAAWKSEKDAYGGIFLMISTPAWKSLLAFPQLPQARRWNHQSGTENGNSNQDHQIDNISQEAAVHLKHGSFWSEEWGAQRSDRKSVV